MELSNLLHHFIHIINEMSPYVLLGFLIAGILHVFVKESTLLHHLSGNNLSTVIKAAAVGVPLPLCSCGVLPTAVSLRRGGASKAATTSFLIATPQTGVDSIAATYSLLGLPFALTRPVAALLCAVFGGSAVGKLCPDKQQSRASAETAGETDRRSFGKKTVDSVKYGFVDMIDNMGNWLVLGLVIATLITVFVPSEWFVGLREYPLAAMLLVVIIAVPMYICATGSIPIAMALMLKGLTPGVAFVLLMAGPAANFASIVILNRTLGRKTTAIYVASVVVTAIAFGALIDYVLPAEWFTPGFMTVGEGHHASMGWFESACSVALALLLMAAAFRRLKEKYANSNQSVEQGIMTQEFKIKGMECNHCRASVEKALSGLQNVEKVTVSLSSGIATVSGEVSAKDVEDAVRNAGFDLA